MWCFPRWFGDWVSIPSGFGASAALILLAALQTGCAHPPLPAAPVPPVPERPALDSAVIATASALVSNAHAIDAVWPGSWNPPGFALYRRDTVVYLYTTNSPPAGFDSLVHPSLPAALDRHFHVHHGPWPGLSGGVFPITAESDRLIMAAEIRTRPSSQVEFVLHESFHGWQIRRFENFFDPKVPQSFPDSTTLPPDLETRLALERQLLIAAVEAGSLVDVRSHVRAFITARKDRLSSGSPLAGQIEHAQERREGTAEYVGLAGALAVIQAHDSALRDSVAVRLRSNQRWGVATRPASRQMWDRTYVSGSAIAFLLDRLRCPSWREAIRGGGDLFQALADCSESTVGQHNAARDRG